MFKILSFKIIFIKGKKISIKIIAYKILLGVEERKID